MFQIKVVYFNNVSVLYNGTIICMMSHY